LPAGALAVQTGSPKNKKRHHASVLTAFVGQATLAEAPLSYLDLGVQEPRPAWGLMLHGGAEEYASTTPGSRASRLR
jgi:ABC-type antimicrobial peptide transport system permease subunit